MPAYIPLEKKFWSKVSVGTTEECWLWTGAKQKPGTYGRVRMPRERRTEYAHRISYEMSKGAIPLGLIVCHRCGNGLCVNPGHLYAGTYTENNLDRIRHGRQSGGARSGEKHHMAKLTDAQRVEIRRRLRAGAQGNALAKEFSISTTQISRIKRYGGERILLVETDALIASNKHLEAM